MPGRTSSLQTGKPLRSPARHELTYFYIPAVQIDEMNAKLAATGGASKIIAYAGAGHGFFADYRESYSPTDAAASWSEATRWLKAHGV